MSVQETNPPRSRTTVLQSKLYQAAQRDKSRRFHALYDKLSLDYVLQSAWELVRRNRGSAGIDGQTLAQIEALGVAAFLSDLKQSLTARTYRPVPVRRVHIPKPDGKRRPLGIPTVRDRVVQAAAKLLLEPIFEADFEGSSFGFRPGLGQQDALSAVETHSRWGYRYVVDADLEAFFDTLDHSILMEALRRRISDGEMLRLIYRWLKAGYLLDGSYHETDQGSPQGGVLSPLLANVYLHGFDQAHRLQKTFIGRLTRYADDFVIQCGTADHAQRALEWVSAPLARLKLKLNASKTRIVNDRAEGFDFLGFHHRRVIVGAWAKRGAGRESKGLMRWPSAKACQKFRTQVRQRIGPCGWLRSHWAQVVEELRLYLTGWCQYYRHGQSTQVFQKLDRYVVERLSRQLARSQPHGKGHKRRRWYHYATRLSSWKPLPRLEKIKKEMFARYRGSANVEWRAV